MILPVEKVWKLKLKVNQAKNCYKHINNKIIRRSQHFVLIFCINQLLLLPFLTINSSQNILIKKALSEFVVFYERLKLELVAYPFA